MSTAKQSAWKFMPWREWQVAAAVGLWLVVLPILLHRYSVPGLLQRLTPPERAPARQDGLSADRAARIVRRVARMRLFDLPCFPRICLRQSLALFRVLRARGYPCEIHFGALKQGDRLHAHSWVSVSGLVLIERNAEHRAYRHLYTYPVIRGPDPVSDRPTGGVPQHSGDNA